MGTPRGTGVDLFIRNTPLDCEEEDTFLQSQADSLIPILRTSTLDDLGSSIFIQQPGHGDQSIKKYSPKVVALTGSDLSLETQGMFSWSRADVHKPLLEERDQRHKSGMKRYWGLMRSGKWIIADAHYVGRGDRSEREHVVHSVEIREASPRLVLVQCKIDIEQVLNALHSKIDYIIMRREVALADAQATKVRLGERTALYVALKSKLVKA